VGQGLLDNTSLTPIMANFMGLSMFEQTLAVRGTTTEPILSGLTLSPVPFDDQFKVGFEVPTASVVSIELFDQLGRKVRTVVQGQNFATGTHSVAVDGTGLRGGLYVAAVTVNGQVISKKTIKL
jgi:alkaline phosphatase